MPRPLVIGYHLIWSAYGAWLPNDPRGSMSTNIRNELLRDLGGLHYGRRRIEVASDSIRDFYRAAAPLLEFPVRLFTGEEVGVIARSFSETIRAHRYTCYACAIMPDHVHVLIRKHRDLAEDMMNNLRRESHIALRESGHFELDHPIWGGHGWKVFLDTPGDMGRTVKYIKSNPAKIGQAEQNWAFVKNYDGWPLTRGHSLSSPYARRLRRG